MSITPKHQILPSNSTTTSEGTTTYSYLFADKVGSISKGDEKFTFTYDGTFASYLTNPEF